MDVEAGTLVDGKYRVVRLLGEGGMGAVYEGENIRIRRRVALKVLHATLASHETAARRFEQEAKAAGMIGSEHIVEVLDFGSLPSGELYLVMEFLEGEDLATRIKRNKRLMPHEAAPIVYQILEGLSAAHKIGIIHRDLKPENVFLVRQRTGQRDFVKVLDFGVSKFSTLSGDAMSMTRTGAVVGTPYYLSPEQARGLRNIDARSDLYSVGVVMYQAITGRLPFSAETFNELVFKIALEAPPPAETVVPDLDPTFAAIIRTAMEREPDARFASAKDFQAAISRWIALNPAPDSIRPTAPETSGFLPSPARTAPRSGTLAMEAMGSAPSPWPSPPGTAMPAPAHPQSSPYVPPPAAPLPYAHPGAPGLSALPLPLPPPAQGVTARGESLPPPPRRAAPVPSSSRNQQLGLLAIGLGTVVLAGLGLGAFFLFGGDSPAPAKSALISTEPSPASSPAPTASAASAETAASDTAESAPPANASAAKSAPIKSTSTPGPAPKATPTLKPSGRRIGNEL